MTKEKQRERLSTEVASTKEHVDLPKLESVGEFPYTRGIHPTMYQGRLWTMRQYAGFGDAEEANARYRYLLEQGTTGLSIAFDLPTQMGRDPDHVLAEGEVGRVGVSVATVEDMERLLDGIPLDEVSVSMTINATANILLAFLLVVAERRGVNWSDLKGTIQNDILKEYIARGTYIYPVKAGVRLVTDLFEHCEANVPQWNTISVSGYHMREAGSTAVQEVSFTLANALAYLSAAKQRGMSVDAVAPRMSFFFNCHNNFFEEIAKFRAARRIWAKVLRERFSPENERSLKLRFHTQTAGSTLTAQQPENNIVRTALQALASVLGGTQSLHTNAYDEALGLPTAESARLALRTQQVIACESGVAEVPDPLGGSLFVEQLTDEIELAVRKQLRLIDDMGGMEVAIENGYPQREIEEAAFVAQRAMESGEQSIVGVNVFRDDQESEKTIGRSNDSVDSARRERLQAFKKSREAKQVSSSLDALRAAAMKPDGQVMAAVIVCARNQCTLGEISDVLREVFGEYGVGI